MYPLFQAAGCADIGCHSGVRSPEGLDLSTADEAYSNLVGVRSGQCANKLRVAPGDPAASYLINKLTGVGLCYGSQMPKTGVSLPQAQIDAIRAWIGGGAQRN